MRKHFTRYHLIACPILVLLFGFAVKAQQGPQISDIIDQTIFEGQEFAAINLDAAVTDPDNSVDELTWEVTNNNELLVSLDNRIAFIETPNSDWFGEETIVFTVYDPDSNFSTDEAVFAVTAVNDAPVISAIPGQTINEGGLFEGFNLNEYVSDPDDPVSSLSWSVEANENLLASINGSNNVNVTVNDADWYGSESLVFTVSDAAGAEDSDAPVFTVNNIEDLPVAQNDSYSVNEGANLSTPAPGVLSNDSDADGDLLSALLVSAPGSSASFTLNADGSFTYLHDGSPDAGDSFTYVADDSKGQSNVATVNITVNPVNDAPVIEGVPGQIVTEGTDFDPIDLDQYISDEEDDNDLLALSTVGSSVLDVEINENTHVATISKPQPKWTGTAAVTFRVSDTQAATDQETVTFTSTELAEAPVAQPDAYNVNEGQVLNTGTASVLDNDTDGDGDPLTADLVSGPSHSLSFTLNPNGTFTYSHNGSETASDAFTYRAFDGTSYSNTVTVTITVNPQNDPPVVSDIPNQTVPEGSNFATINLDDYVSDPDHADNLINWTYSGNLALTVSISASRVATINIPSSEWNGTENITFTATDPSSTSDSDPATFTVTNVNDPPVVSDIPNQTITEGAGFAAINLNNYVDDPDHADNQIYWTYSGNSQLTVSINSSNVATVSIPNIDWNGSEIITFRATDPGSLFDDDPATFTVTNINDNPVLSGIEGTALTYNEGEPAKPVTGSMTVTDIDNVLSSATIEIISNYHSDQDVLAYTGGTLSANWNSAAGQLILNGSSSPAVYQNALRQVTYRNTSSSPSTEVRTVRFIVNDGIANSNAQSRNITINSANSAPVLADPVSSNINYTENAGAVQLTNTITITDEDNTNLTAAQISIASSLPEDQLNYTSFGGITGMYSGGMLSLTGTTTLANYRSALRSVTYHNTSDAPVTTNRIITFTVTDGSALSNSISKTVTITPANDPPVLEGIETTTLAYAEGAGPVQITNTLNVTDVENSNLISALISFSSGYQNGQDVLAFTNGFGLTGSWNATTGELLLSGSASLLQMRNALRSVTYENTSKNPSTATRVIRFQVSDGDNSNIVTRNISLSTANNPPVLAEPLETPVSFTENGGSVRLTNTITVTDDDNTNLSSATVRIVTGFVPDQDILTFTNAPGVTGVYNSSTGILNFTGSATLATYQTVLRNVRYDNSSEAPNITNRVISFVVNDGTGNSNIIEKTVTITAANDPPVASNLTITAINNNVGTLHTANFTFTDPDGDDPGTHTYQWYRSAFASGVSPVAITGATAATYRPVKADGGNFIGFEVTPVDKGGTAGATVRINPFIYINAAPVASNVSVYAPLSVPGSTISGRFKYSDKENNPRGNAIYRWYRSNVSNPTPASPGTQISTDSTYLLKGSESGKWVWFRVSPVATAGSSPGDSVWSNVIGPIGAYTASISGSDTFCYGAVMPITLTITGGKDPFEATLRRTGFLPKDTVISNITSSPRIINVRIPGTYALIEVSDAGGDKADVTASTPVVLVINTRSKARIIGSTSICQGVETHAPLTLDFLSGTPPWSVTIRRGETSANDTILTGLQTDPSVFISRIIGTGPTRHRVVAISDANGCPGDTASGSAWLSYKTSPIAVISGSDSICPGETTLLTVTLTSGTPPWSFTYQRNGVNAGTYSNIPVNSQTFSVSQQGIYTLSVVSDASGTGCGSGQAVIGLYTPPTAGISGTATICEHTSANLTVNLTGKAPWKFGYHRNLTFDSTVVENVLTSPRTVAVRKAGTYRLYEVTDRNGCSGTVSGSAVITVTPAPVVTISGLKKAYNYKENEIDTIVGTPLGGEYSGPGVIGNYFLPFIAGLGTHNITYRYRTSPASCWGYDTALVNVLESNSIILFENSRTRYCKNDAPFIVTGVNLEDVTGSFTISGGAGIVDHGDNTATVYPNLLNPNRYTITYTYYFGGDVFPKNAEFDIGPAPLSQFSWATECYHDGQSINFINKSSSSFGFLTDTSYFWNIRNLKNGNNYVYHADSTRDIEFIFPNYGTYEVGLRIVNSYGCSDTSLKVFNLRQTYNLNERYYENFALHPISWQSSSETAVNSWKLGNPSKHEIPPRGFSGAYKDTACWYTKITAIPAPEENSWVTSPCFDFSESDRPMLTMQIWRLFNANRDGANIQVTADSGKTWDLVGELGDGENWFNTSNIRGEPGGKDDGWSNYDGISNDNTWVRARHGLDFLKGKKDVQFRIAYGSDGTPQNNDGIAFDDFTISERTKMALIEHFTNTGSASAEKADSVLDLFAGQYGVHALDIQYHTSNPGGDPFYEDNPIIPTSRQFYYGLSTVPYAVIDGGSINRHLIDYKADSKPFDRNVIIRQSLSDSKFQISVNASRNGNTLNSTIRIVANEPLPLMELSVRTAVVESLIRGISGTNGDTLFRNVVRTMLPDAAGNTLYKSWSLIEDMEIDYSWEIENVNDINRLIVISFIQNEASREIFNVAVDTVDLLNPSDDPLPIPPSGRGFMVYPNPASAHAIVQLDNRADNDIILQLFSNTGMMVYSTRIQSGDLSAIVPVDAFPDGLYMLRLTSGNTLLGIRKLIITK